MTDRERKFKQAAFAYLIVGLLYESAVLAMMRRDLLPSSRGPAWVWLVFGAAIVALVVWSLWRFQKPWIARAIFIVHSLRLPALIGGAFFPAAEARVPPSFYGAALVIVILNLWMLARAGWDL